METGSRAAAGLSLESVVEPSDNCGSLVLRDEMVIVHEPSGRAHVLNQSGALIWQCLDGTSSLADIANDVADVFSLPPEGVQQQVVDLVRSLGTLGMLADVSPHLAALPLDIIERDALGCDGPIDPLQTATPPLSSKYLGVPPNA